jgi:cupin fold WbuC family metalloprotein
MPASFVSLNDPETCWRDSSARSTGYFSRTGIVRIDRALHEELKAAARATGGNVRLSLHTGPGETLHQMVIAQHAALYNRPKVHHATPKSWHMIEGRMAIVIFDAAGAVLDRAVIGDGNGVLYRIPAGTYHTNIPLSPLVIHEETQLGPYVGDTDRSYAAFSPDGSDPTAARDYLASLLAGLDPIPDTGETVS